MKWYLVIFALAGSVPAWASYSIKAEMERPGSPSVSGTVVVDEGGFGTITFNTVTISFTPTGIKHNVVKIETEIDQRDGAKRSVSKPTIITRFNNPAEVSERAEDGTLMYRLRLTPAWVAN